MKIKVGTKLKFKLCPPKVLDGDGTVMKMGTDNHKQKWFVIKLTKPLNGLPVGETITVYLDEIMGIIID